ncbi:hypothetical protein CspeluHIS016_0201070 [Cutaneotrichosporon spelunceum]|uniref:Uncharacterized protein n=1 Tax=Cutaneotrichosporon spelunceum TaxID=1672016 RepID=A0AAD3TR91_9TREE|nr:hypothetical protein CspeluHIS016_0201070 [Cutaneotrichosporon spelunceum]
MPPRAKKASKTISLIQQYEGKTPRALRQPRPPLHPEREEKQKDPRRGGCVGDYIAARSGGELQAQCQARFAQLIADLEAQDDIIAAGYATIEELSADTELLMAKEVELANAELGRAIKESTAAKAGLENAQSLESSTLSAVGLTVSVHL